MTENAANFPYVIQLDEPLQMIRLSEQVNGIGIPIGPTNVPNVTSFNEINHQIVTESSENPTEAAGQEFEVMSGSGEDQCIFQIVYPKPQDLNLKPSTLKRGRPKKKKTKEKHQEEDITKPAFAGNVTVIPPSTARTRSGRLVKLPKHIEMDFKKIEISSNDPEIQVSNFQRYDEKENDKLEFVNLPEKKNNIKSQYRCPKCLKAYLGKNKMIQHLKKFPEHGPFPEGSQEYNFDVWNYLFDITQKSKPGQRGMKFCEELSNLLHNVQLLKNSLFKSVGGDNINCVTVDKVLGNAIGLSPGKYKFNENELYKDVTVLKLITNTDFFKPNKLSDSDNLVNKIGNSDDVEMGQNEPKSDDGANISDFVLADASQIRSDLIDNTQNGGNDENIQNNSGDAKIGKNLNESVNYPKKIEEPNRLSLHSDLISENLLIHGRNSVDELMLSTVDNGSNLLDNSAICDEVMNVDQFANERLRKIIEPDIELGNNSLNLDLPNLDIFPFNTS